MASLSSVNSNNPGMFRSNEVIFNELVSAPLSGVNRTGNTTIYIPVNPPSGKCRIFLGPQLNETASLAIIQILASIGQTVLSEPESFAFIFFNNLKRGEHGPSETDPLKCKFRCIQIAKEDLPSFELVFSIIQGRISIAITKNTCTLVGPDGDRQGVAYIPEMPDTYVIDSTISAEEWDAKIAEEMKKDGYGDNKDLLGAKTDSKSK